MSLGLTKNILNEYFSQRKRIALRISLLKIFFYSIQAIRVNCMISVLFITFILCLSKPNHQPLTFSPNVPEHDHLAIRPPPLPWWSEDATCFKKREDGELISTEARIANVLVTGCIMHPTKPLHNGILRKYQNSLNQEWPISNWFLIFYCQSSHDRKW